MRTITFALTHFNRFDLIVKAIAPVLNDERVREVVISDDASTDGSYEELEAHCNINVKLKLYRNVHNQDCYRNKRMAVEHSTSDWVILFDSDNVLGKDYLDALYAFPNWESDTIYCPARANPHFDYSAFSGLTITRENVASLAAKPHFLTLLNTANYFVHRANYLEVWDGSVDPVTADSLFQAYNWLKSGRRMRVVSGLQYFHRVHDKSHYKLNCHRTGNIYNETVTKLLALT